MVRAGGCFGSQPPQPSCPLLLFLLLTFSTPAFSSVIKATDLRITTSNFVSGSIFNENTQGAVTNTASGSLRCSIGVTGKGVPINCASNVCTNRLTATNTLPDISAFDSHLCADPSLYHPKIQNIVGSPRSTTCLSPYTVDVNIATSGQADTYIRAMSYRYAGQWIKNYTPKCWAGLDNTECPVSGTSVNNHRVLLVTLPAAPTASQKKSHCCSNAIGGPSSPRFETFTQDPSGVSSSRYEQSISTLAACGVELHTEFNCGSFCSYCPGTSRYNNWKASLFCMCEPSGTQCGTCRACNGSPPYACVGTSTSPGANTYGCYGACKQCSGGTCSNAPNGTSCGGECEECQNGVCVGISGGSCGVCGTCSSGYCNDPGLPSCTGQCEFVQGCGACGIDTTCTPTCGPCETPQMGVCINNCAPGENCCSGTCQAGSCNPCQGITCSGCSTCQGGSCVAQTCPPGQTLDTNTCTCSGGGNICTSDTQCASGEHCCGGSCNNFNCTPPTNRLNRSTCTCECWSVQTCTGGQTWNPTTCQCEGGSGCSASNPCSGGQVCCGVAPNRSCQAPVTNSSCGTCRRAHVNQCRCENTPGVACGQNGCGTCLNNGTCDTSGCVTCTPTICKECDSNNNLVNSTNGTPCGGGCQECQNGSCVSSCTSNQVCCGSSCQARETTASCGANQRPSADGCRCEPISCPPCNSCQQCQGGSCVDQSVSCTAWNYTPDPSTICVGVTFTQTGTRSCTPSGCDTESDSVQATGTKPAYCNYGSWQDSWGSCSNCTQTNNRTRSANPTCGATCNDTSDTQTRSCGNGSSCGTCGTCNNGTCNEPTGCGACGCSNGACNPEPTCACGVNSATCTCNPEPTCACGVNSATCACNSAPPEPTTCPGTCQYGCTHRLDNSTCSWSSTCNNCNPGECEQCNSQGQVVNAPNGTSCGTPNSCNTCQNGTCTAPNQNCPSGQSWDSSTCQCEGGSTTVVLGCNCDCVLHMCPPGEMTSSCTCPAGYSAVCYAHHAGGIVSGNCINGESGSSPLCWDYGNAVSTGCQ